MSLFHPINRLRAIVGHLKLQPELGQHGLGHTLVDGVVLHQQHQATQAAHCAVGRHVRCRRGRLGGRGSQHTRQRALQISAPYRLVEVAQDAGPRPRLRVGAGVGGAQHHQPRARQRRLTLDVLRQLQAVHAGHVHVQHRQLEGFAQARRLGHGGQRLRATVDTAYPHVPALQLLQQDVAVGLVVVHHQHAHFMQQVRQHALKRGCRHA